ncbi:alpha/beta hydrolase [Halobacteriales archaeon QS_1_68_20]|nr:MAG: alpha/beta hydrolase [Halobacteriales archaeon QS_1_68_20]
MPEPLDDEVRDLLGEFEAAGLLEWHRLSVASARRVEDDLFSPDPLPEVALRRDLAFEGPAGEVPVRVYRDVDPPAPVLVFLHGGGWTLGTLDSADDICAELARRGECVVVSVDYRLAPEHPFPAALDDAWAALSWAAETAEAFGGDPDRLQVGGTSAGGNLAAATALRAATFDGPDLDHQLLVYPMIDPGLDTDSADRRADAPLLTRADVEWFWDQYLRSPVNRHSPFAAPLRADDLGGVAPATVVTAGHDLLRDEGAAYASRLAEAGVAVDHRNYPAMPHGFLSFTDDVDAADAAMDEVGTAIDDPP